MLFSGGADILADPTDVKRLVAQLPKATSWTVIPDYAHLDFGMLYLSPPFLESKFSFKLKSLGY